MDTVGRRHRTPPQVVVVIGPPGAGKGTQCEASAGPGVIHLSTGDALRRAIRSQTELGRRVADEIALGGLVADDIVLDIVSDAVAGLEPDDIVLLDGFPRTIAQADALLGRLDAPPALVLELTVPSAVLHDRLSHRVVCSRCGRSGTRRSASRSLRAVCRCGGTMEHRADDLPDHLERRLEIFVDEHRRVVDRLRSAGTPHRVVDGSRAAEVVADGFAAALALYTGRPAPPLGAPLDARLRSANVTMSSSSTIS